MGSCPGRRSHLLELIAGFRNRRGKRMRRGWRRGRGGGGGGGKEESWLDGFERDTGIGGWLFGILFLYQYVVVVVVYEEDG